MISTSPIDVLFGYWGMSCAGTEISLMHDFTVYCFKYIVSLYCIHYITVHECDITMLFVS